MNRKKKWLEAASALMANLEKRCQKGSGHLCTSTGYDCPRCFEERVADALESVWREATEATSKVDA